MQRTPTHPTARWLLIAVEVLIAANAVYGGIGLMVNGMGMPMEWLDRTPFDSWVLPGVFLLILIAGPMAVAAAAELKRLRWAYALSLGAGIIQIGWIAVQILVLARYFFLQPVLLLAGAIVVGLAWWSHRGDGRWSTVASAELHPHRRS